MIFDLFRNPPQHKISTRDLLDIPSLSLEDIHTILRRARIHKYALGQRTHFRKKLEDKVIINLFAEPSTRTRVSFEMAAYRLGAKIISWDEATSSATKGETFSDTIKYLSGYNPDAIIIRHKEYNAPHYVAKMVNCPVINAGDSYRAHPTQALLDAFTILECKKSIEGLTVAICGDVAHSRVASDNINLLTRMGARVHVIAPEHLLPKQQDGIHLFTNMKDGLHQVDIIMMLRIQKERMDSASIPNEVSYFHSYGLTSESIKFAKPDALVMHPGPMNRGVEISDDIADDPHRSIIFEQGANGVPVRMAILDLLLS